jgi:hypothetical protein
VGPARQSWRRDAEATGCDGEEREREREEGWRGVRESDKNKKGRRGRTRGVAGVDAGTGARELPWPQMAREGHVAERERRRFVGSCGCREHRIRVGLGMGLFGCLGLGLATTNPMIWTFRAAQGDMYKELTVLYVNV